MLDPTTPPAPTWAAPMQEEVRRAVAAAGPRYQLPARCWVGHPGGALETEVVEAVSPDDAQAASLSAVALAGLRTELVQRALGGLDDLTGALCWLTLPGPLEAGALELAWWAAARRGFAEHGVQPAAFCLVNRTGWLDLDSGLGRTWSRVRLRRVQEPR